MWILRLKHVGRGEIRYVEQRCTVCRLIRRYIPDLDENYEICSYRANHLNKKKII